MPSATLTSLPVCRHSGPPPDADQHPDADNPLLSAIERAGQADARTVRMRTSHFVARTSPVCARLSGQQEARPLLSPGRPADGPRLVRLVRRALSFEQPPLCGTAELQRGRAERRTTSETQPDRPPDGRTEEEDAEERTSSRGPSERVASELVSNGASERLSNGRSDCTSNGTSERVSNGTSEPVSNGSCEQISNGSSGSYSNGHGVSNGTGVRALDGDQVENGTSALNKKGSRNFKSNNLIKRLFKKEEPEPEDEVETRQQETVSSS